MSGGGFEFFRKYQKLILYTAVLFALLSFSITGAVLGFFTAAPPFEGAKMTLPDGKQISITREDHVVGGWLLRALGDPAVVLPDITSEEGREGLRDRLAALRRLAIEYGIDASYDEADRAIAQAIKVFPQIETPTQLAIMLGHGSLEAYRVVVREALRVGTFLRLQIAGVDTSDAALAAKLLEDDEMLTLQVATLDKKAREEALKEGGVSDEDLTAWLEGLDENERRRFSDPNKSAVTAVGLIYGEFDKAQFAAELGDTEESMTEAQISAAYMARREQFRKPEPEEDENGEEGGEESGGEESADPESGETENAETTEEETETEAESQEPEAPEDPYKPLDEVRDDVVNMLLAEAALDAVRFGVVQDALSAHVADALTARNAALRAEGEARKALAEAKKAEQDGSGSEEAVTDAEAAVEAAEEASKAAATALEDRRKTFDFQGVMTGALAGRPGIKTHTITPPAARDDLKDMGDLGTWEQPHAATAVREAGMLSTQIQRTETACFHFQVPELVVAPLKSLDDIRDEATTAYFAEQVDEAAETDKEAFEAKLLELAKAQIAERIQELTDEAAADLETEFSEWKTGLEERKAAAEAAVAANASRPDSRAYKSWQAELAEVEGALAKADEKRDELQKASDEALEEKIAEESRAAYKDVLVAAAADHGFEVSTIGPYSVQLQQRPRFRYRYDEATRYLFGNSEVTELDAGEATGILDDTTGRALHVVVATAREKADASTLDRRRMNQNRQSFVEQRLIAALKQSFSLEALEKRWGYESPNAREEEETR